MASIADSLKTSSINITNISKSLFETKRSVSSVNDSVANISRIISTNTRIKRDVFANTQLIESRRREALKRKEIEDQLESSKVSSSPARGLAFAGRSDKGPLGRLLGFLGFITAGWIVENLPTWIFMGQEFVTRIQIFGRSMYNMIGNMQLIIDSFGSVLKNSFNAIITLDFSAFSEGSVAQSFDELNLAVQGLGDDITETFKLFTTPLNKSIETGEQAPGLGEDRPETMFPSSEMRTVTGIHKRALDIIAGPESGGSYNAMNQGTIGENIVGSTSDSKTKIGKELTSMTLGEIMQRQAYLMDKRNPQVSNYGVYAAGKYQIIPGTFPSAMKGAGLKPTDMFSPDNQDKMGLAVLKSQGIGAWTVGGSKYSAKETAIIKEAQRTPVSYAAQTPQPPKPPSGKGNGFLTSSDLVKVGNLAYPPDYQDWYKNSAMLNPSAAKGFLAAQKAYGQTIPVNSAYRSYEHQRNVKGAVKASPGTSRHGLGLALDLEPGTPYYNWMVKNGPKFGWYYAKIPGDPYHFEYRGAGSSMAEIQSAQISAQPKASQSAAMTPQRKGSQIVFIDATQPQAPQVSYPSQQPTVTPTISEFKLLNNFIKNKLLLDLAYL